MLSCCFLAQDCIILCSIWGGELSLPTRCRESCQVYRRIKESLCDTYTVEIRLEIIGVVL